MNLGSRSEDNMSQLQYLNKIYSNCDKCNGTGKINPVIKDNSLIYKECTCRQELKIKRSLVLSDIGLKFYDINSKQILSRDVIVPKVSSFNISELIQRIISKRDSLFSNGIGINFWGENGRGKSFIAKYIGKEFILLNYDVHYMPFFLFLDLVKKETKDNLLKEILDVNLLILDDIGDESNYKSSLAGEAAYFLKRRASKNKINIFIINGEIKEENIAEKYGSLFSSALHERNINVKFNGDRIIDDKRYSLFVKRILLG